MLYQISILYHEKKLIQLPLLKIESGRPDCLRVFCEGLRVGVCGESMGWDQEACCGGASPAPWLREIPRPREQCQSLAMPSMNQQPSLRFHLLKLPQSVTPLPGLPSLTLEAGKMSVTFLPTVLPHLVPPGPRKRQSGKPVPHPASMASSLDFNHFFWP